jgi:hypothetical protein
VGGPDGWKPDRPGNGAWPEVGLIVLALGAVLVVAVVWWLVARFT